MILRGKTPDDLPLATKLCVLLVAILVLPLALSATSANEPPVAADSSKPAGTPEIFHDAAVEPVDVNARLDRMEKVLEALANELHQQRNSPSSSEATVAAKEAPKPVPTATKTTSDAGSRRNKESRVISAIVDIQVGDESLEALPEKEQQRLASLTRTINRVEQLMQTNYNRYQAAVVSLKAVQEAYQKDTASLDLLLDSQRREAVASIDLTQNLVDLASALSSDEYKVLMALHHAKALRTARDRALDTWRGVHALFEQGKRGGEAEKEAQAREQYFLFREQLEVATSDLTEALRGVEAHTKQQNVQSAAKREQ